jgi:hypothetical protein
MLSVLLQVIFVLVILAAVVAYFRKRRQKLRRMDIEEKLGY